MEVPNRDGELIFYNLSYARKQKQQTVYLQQGWPLLFCPGKNHERQVQDWLIKDMARFLKQ